MWQSFGSRGAKGMPSTRREPEDSLMLNRADARGLPERPYSGQG